MTTGRINQVAFSLDFTTASMPPARRARALDAVVRVILSPRHTSIRGNRRGTHPHQPQRLSASEGTSKRPVCQDAHDRFREAPPTREMLRGPPCDREGHNNERGNQQRIRRQVGNTGTEGRAQQNKSLLLGAKMKGTGGDSSLTGQGACQPAPS